MIMSVMIEMVLLDGKPGLFIAVFGGIALVIITIAAVVLRDMFHTLTGRK